MEYMDPTPTCNLVACIFTPPGQQQDASTYLFLHTLLVRPQRKLQVHMLYNPSPEMLKQQVTQLQPAVIYLGGPRQSLPMAHHPTVHPLPANDEMELFRACSAVRTQLLYVDAPTRFGIAELLEVSGAMSVLVWPLAPLAVVAEQFATAFFATLAVEHVSSSEAVAIARLALMAHMSVKSEEGSSLLIQPIYLSADGAPAILPDTCTIPQPQLDYVDLSRGLAATLPEWSDIRLLAPRAELRLLIAGEDPHGDTHRLRHVEDALRALLMAEVRRATVASVAPLMPPPTHLPPTSAASRIDFSTATGATATVVIAARPTTLSTGELLTAALRQTLAADSHSLHFIAPPTGSLLPGHRPRSSSTVAGGVPLLDAVVLTSVWAVSVLRQLCQDPSYRCLTALGVVAIGGTAVAASLPSDAFRLSLICCHSSLSAVTSAYVFNAPPAALPQSMPDPQVEIAVKQEMPYLDRMPMQESMSPSASGPLTYGVQDSGVSSGKGTSFKPPYSVPAHMTAVGDHRPTGEVDNGRPSVSRGPDDNPLLRAAAVCILRTKFNGVLPGYVCHRTPLSHVTEEEFLDDLVIFLQLLRGRQMDRSKFPDAILNGTSVDIFALYREVATRGGFRAANSINWRGHVFTKMRNWTQDHRQTGVGNSLKRHYQNYLLDYEMAHPEDVPKDSRPVYGDLLGGEELTYSHRMAH